MQGKKLLMTTDEKETPEGLFAFLLDDGGSEGERLVIGSPSLWVTFFVVNDLIAGDGRVIAMRTGPGSGSDSATLLVHIGRDNPDTNENEDVYVFIGVPSFNVTTRVFLLDNTSPSDIPLNRLTWEKSSDTILYVQDRDIGGFDNGGGQDTGEIVRSTDRFQTRSFSPINFVNKTYPDGAYNTFGPELQNTLAFSVGPGGNGRYLLPIPFNNKRYIFIGVGGIDRSNNDFLVKNYTWYPNWEISDSAVYYAGSRFAGERFQSTEQEMWEAHRDQFGDSNDDGEFADDIGLPWLNGDGDTITVKFYDGSGSLPGFVAGSFENIGSSFVHPNQTQRDNSKPRGWLSFETNRNFRDTGAWDIDPNTSQWVEDESKASLITWLNGRTDTEPDGSTTANIEGDHTLQLMSYTLDAGTYSVQFRLDNGLGTPDQGFFVIRVYVGGTQIAMERSETYTTLQNNGTEVVVDENDFSAIDGIALGVDFATFTVSAQSTVVIELTPSLDCKSFSIRMPESIDAWTDDYGVAVFRSTDGGQTFDELGPRPTLTPSWWERFNQDKWPFAECKRSPTTGTWIMLLGGRDYNASRIYRSTDDGASWTQIGYTDTSFGTIYEDGDPNALEVFTYTDSNNNTQEVWLALIGNTFLKSTNDGQNFTFIGEFGGPMVGLAPDTEDGWGRIYTMSNETFLLESTDYGGSWQYSPQKYIEQEDFDGPADRVTVGANWSYSGSALVHSTGSTEPVVVRFDNVARDAPFALVHDVSNYDQGGYDIFWANFTYTPNSDFGYDSTRTPDSLDPVEARIIPTSDFNGQINFFRTYPIDVKAFETFFVRDY